MGYQCSSELFLCRLRLARNGRPRLLSSASALSRIVCRACLWKRYLQRILEERLAADKLESESILFQGSTPDACGHLLERFDFEILLKRRAQLIPDVSQPPARPSPVSQGGGAAFSSPGIPSGRVAAGLRKIEFMSKRQQL